MHPLEASSRLIGTADEHLKRRRGEPAEEAAQSARAREKYLARMPAHSVAIVTVMYVALGPAITRIVVVRWSFLVTRAL